MGLLVVQWINNRKACGNRYGGKMKLNEDAQKRLNEYAIEIGKTHVNPGWRRLVQEKAQELFFEDEVSLAMKYGGFYGNKK